MALPLLLSRPWSSWVPGWCCHSYWRPPVAWSCAEAFSNALLIQVVLDAMKNLVLSPVHMHPANLLRTEWRALLSVEDTMALRGLSRLIPILISSAVNRSMVPV